MDNGHRNSIVIMLSVLILMTSVDHVTNGQILRKESQTFVRLAPGNNYNGRPTAVRTCNVDCSRETTQFVCGTDGRTYNNRCELQRVNCELSPVPSSAVQIKHAGRCNDKYRCRSERAHAQAILQGANNGHSATTSGANENQRKTAANLFEPKCLEDGSYAPVQCHSATGYCWCVTPTGRPVRGSSVRNRRPKCKKRRAAAILGKMGSRRSSSVKRNGGPIAKNPINKPENCNQADKTIFKKNLVKIFSSEYLRMTSLSRTPIGSVSTTMTTMMDGLNSNSAAAEKRAVDWKFNELDKNGNQFLDKKEVKSLRRMVKKIVKPKECAKRLIKFCDLDRNRRISRNEWTVCFGMGANKEQTTALVSGHGDDDHDHDIDHAHDSSDQLGHRLRPTNHDNTQGVSLTGHPKLPTSRSNKQTLTLTTVDDKIVSGLDEESGDDDDDDDDDEEEDMDCKTERQNALEQQRATQDSLYIPECDLADDSRTYAQIQCYKSTDYCWCVDKQNGKPIPNTSVRFMRPDCDRLIRAERPIKGCPAKKKLKFVADFIEFLTKEMNSALNQTQSQQNEETAIVDSVAKWKFSNLDLNNNKVLDRKEWRIFRVELKKRNSIRKCGRNFVKFCDENDDKKIAYTEWQDCFSVLVERIPNTPSRGNKRPNGPNPLITYLKND